MCVRKPQKLGTLYRKALRGLAASDGVYPAYHTQMGKTHLGIIRVN
jgi:hypothetical protein